ncbi:two-component system sensor histidine kinase VanS [Microbacterium resistens]|uniref:histidine kinase n=1 Tax=Microbacterium resistens TaxID=156977 RepID=A0ABU1SEP1_9MICO|nr:HAMP domain-containing sensor histidine kinase [Microbacterium resistens]MDR6868022.1 two-component system sensor histidine kinase VanS [Microbacterium resistens]
MSVAAATPTRTPTPLPARRLTFRWRLTLAFGAIAFGAGTLVIALLYLYMRFVPTYMITSLPSEVPDDPKLQGLASAAPTVPSEGIAGLTDASWMPAATVSIRGVADLLETLLWAGIAILVVLTVLAGWAGWAVSGRMMRPLAQIGEAAHRAGEGSLDHRIALGGPNDEIRDLADTFDHTLDRLQRAFTAHERFASNAAHELRTPLTATKTLLDVARAHPGAVDGEMLLERVRQNNDRSIELVQALLALTSVEAGAHSSEPVDLSALARDAVRRVAEAEGARGTDLDPVLTLAPAWTEAEPVLAALLVDNLVQNAVRHNDERGLIRISTGPAGDRVRLRVENTGPLIPRDEVVKLTEPLYRARRDAGGGYGLGLAMARSVAEVHGAELRLEPRDGGGLIVTVSFRRRIAT